MKLKTYNKENTIVTDSPKISFRTKGIITLNKAASDLLEISFDDTIEICQDQDSPRDWYINHNAGKTGFILRPTKNKGVYFSCKQLSEAVLESLGFDKTISMLISKEKVQIGSLKYHPIITRSAK